jgi:hypothetical protein
MDLGEQHKLSAPETAKYLGLAQARFQNRTRPNRATTRKAWLGYEHPLS